MKTCFAAGRTACPNAQKILKTYHKCRACFALDLSLCSQLFYNSLAHFGDLQTTVGDAVRSAVHKACLVIRIEIVEMENVRLS